MGEEPGRLIVATPQPAERRAGARGGPPGCLLLVVLALWAAAPVGVRGQEPPDTLPRDTAGVQERPDTLAQDTAAVDTVFYNLPELDPSGPSGWETGAWEWDHEAILNSGATTLVELLREVPGVVPLLAGDYGDPSGITAFGVGAGRVRILRDGFEVVPLGGGVADLTRVGLGGIARVRLERGGGELRIEMTSLRHDDPRPRSLIEAGTGDLDTNLFRGVFLGPRALGGSLGVGLERADSRGARGDESGQRTGSWLRYQLHRGDAAGLAFDFRRMSSETAAEPYAASVTRTDWTVRGRVRLASALTGEVYHGRSTHRVEDTREAYAREGGARSQTGVRASLEAAAFRGRAAYRRFGGDDLPGDRLDLELSASDSTFGGFSAGLDRAGWEGETTTRRHARAWTRPIVGFSLFGSWESGTVGARTRPLLDVVPPPDTTEQEPDTAQADPGPTYRITDRSASRVGASFRWRGLMLAGARLRFEADSLLPLGIEPDRAGPALPGGERTGWEVGGRVPLPLLSGLALEGSLQQWDEPLPYLPERIYEAALRYHRTFLESGNFELWTAIGVRGRDPMTVRQVAAVEEDEEGNPVIELGAVPFAQSWHGRIQMRIVSVRIYVAWENFTIRRNLQDFPDRLLPQTRAVYGLRWSMWN